ncbi:MAG: hypothetical protein LBP39_03300 [Rickettsiales bacterium]|jgi:hypothetical protein|nr:hypothetical protein [Rickettsiales bacterium]
MFIELDKNGNILACAEFKFSENCVETAREIVRSKDGRLYFRGEEPKTDELEDRKKEIISKKRKELEDSFYSEYPIYKQCNVAIYGTDEEKLAFKNFHDEKVTDFHNFATLLDKCVSLGELDELCSLLDKE